MRCVALQRRLDSVDEFDFVASVDRALRNLYVKRRLSVRLSNETEIALTTDEDE